MARARRTKRRTMYEDALALYRYAQEIDDQETMKMALADMYTAEQFGDVPWEKEEGTQCR